MTKKIKSIISVSMAALVAVTAMGYSVVFSGEKTVKADNGKDKAAIESAIKDNVQFNITGEDKEETVYIISDSDGNVKNTIVSDWLKNKEGNATITDKSDLKNIKNVKSDADYTEDKDGNIIWNAEGADIYYQGETDKPLPVDVKITYLLDGKEMKAADIAGKSGKVTIRFEYTNHEKQEVTIMGKKVNMYVPFTMISGTVLDGNVFSNVEIHNGKVISDGSKYIVVGVAFPGMNDNLNLNNILEKNDNDRIELPETVEITADVKEFSLPLTLTMGSADLIAQINMEDVTAMEDINELVESLVSATGELKSGTTQIKNGLSELNTSFAEYAHGAGTLISGINEINNGVAQLNAKTGEFTDGLSTALSGVDTIIEQMGGENGAVAGAQALAGGAAQVDTGVDTLTQKMGTLTGAVSTLTEGSNMVNEKLGTAIDAFKDKSDAQPGLTTGSQAVAAGVNELQTQLTGMVAQINVSIEDNMVKMQQISAILEGGISPNTGTALTQEEIATYQASLNQLGGANAALNTILTQMNPEQMNASLSALSAGAASVSGGVSQVETGLTQLQQEGTSVVANGLNELNSQIPVLTEGIAALKAGTSQVSTGAAALSTGICTLNDALTNQLRPGINSLYEGGILFRTSIETLYNGTKQAAEGGNTLNTATVQVSEGITKLYDGSVTLDNGMGQFKEEAIDKIEDISNNQLKEISERVEAIAETANHYTIFSDAAENKSTSVKFIYETEGV